jgi:hypothetical protein
MTTSGFMTSFTKIEHVLKTFNLLKMKGVKSLTKDGVSKEFKAASIKDEYFDCYNIGLSFNDFDFLLIDQSYFQFEYNNKGSNLEIRYAFFQTPINYISYEDFLDIIIEAQNLSESKEDIGEMFEAEYQQFLNEKEVENKYITIRYDVDYKNYKPLVHSISHLHIGHQNNIRIPIEKFISPLTFVLFILKNVYYSEWKEMNDKNNHYINIILKQALNGEVSLKSTEWSNFEKLELHLK